MTATSYMKLPEEYRYKSEGNSFFLDRPGSRETVSTCQKPGNTVFMPVKISSKGRDGFEQLQAMGSENVGEFVVPVSVQWMIKTILPALAVRNAAATLVTATGLAVVAPTAGVIIGVTLAGLGAAGLIISLVSHSSDVNTVADIMIVAKPVGAATYLISYAATGDPARSLENARIANFVSTLHKIYGKKPDLSSPSRIAEVILERINASIVGQSFSNGLGAGVIGSRMGADQAQSHDLSNLPWFDWNGEVHFSLAPGNNL